MRPAISDFRRSSARGFTLVELAIVLAVAGVLFAGLYNLISSGNQQARDGSAATQQTQLIGAVKGFLASTYGTGNTGYLTYNTVTTANGGCNSSNCVVGAKITLPLPTSCSPATFSPAEADPNLQHICDYLPSGFTSGSVNSYGQTYAVQLLRDNVTPSGTPPAAYSFMVLTQNGTQIPDASGGRIASLIGGDGGFVYSSTNICGSPTNDFACGAYGAWTADLKAAYGFAYPATGGYIASRTYISSAQSSGYTWLARVVMPNDATFSFNTMQTALYMGSANGVSPYANIYLAPSGQTTNGSTINLEGGTITGNANTTSQILMVDTAQPANPLISLATTCSSLTTPGCPAAINVATGDVNLPNGELQANTLFAQTFVYTLSDIHLKTDIRPIPNELDSVMKLNPVEFAFKSNHKQGMGVIAQQLAQVYPQLVSRASNGVEYVNYEGLIGPLISAIQDLKHENDQLRQTLDDQAAHIKKLEAQSKRRSLQ